MSEGGTNIKLTWLERIKKIKHIEIYILLVFVSCIGLMLFSSRRSDSSKADTSSIESYIASTETRLEKILSNIDGVSNVKVMISLDISELSINSSSNNIDSFPSIKGIIVTAKGVDDTKSKMKVLHAIETVLDVNSHNIQIFSSN